MFRQICRRLGAIAWLALTFCVRFAPCVCAGEQDQAVAEIAQRIQRNNSPPAFVFNVQAANEQLQLMVNESKVLSLDSPIPTAQVNNPELLELTAVSPTQVQIHPKKPGVTQVNLWTEDGDLHTVDVHVVPDARELEFVLQQQFPNASLRVTVLTSSVVLRGRVDEASEVRRIIEIAQDYHPKVINNITVGGVQQVLLHCKAMEVSRTKLRAVGMDWANLNGDDLVASGVSGLLGAIDGTTGFGAGGAVGGVSNATFGSAGTFSYSVVNGGNSFFHFMQMLQQRDLAKLLSEPTLVTISGRPAYFNVGGEVPVPASGLGAATVVFRPYGTQVDFVPIVLGSGRIRLDVRPRVSEIDPSVNVNGIPGFKVRTVDTAVEVNAGQTLALAGLVQTRIEAHVRGLPWVSDLPYVGAMFRSTREQQNEVELLILCTPQLVDGMDCHEVPQGGPGMNSGSPTDSQLYAKGHIEVPGQIRGDNCRAPVDDSSWNCYQCPPRFQNCPNGACQCDEGSVYPGGAAQPSGMDYQQYQAPAEGELLPTPDAAANSRATLGPVRSAQAAQPVARSAARPKPAGTRAPANPPRLMGGSGYDTQK